MHLLQNVPEGPRVCAWPWTGWPWAQGGPGLPPCVEGVGSGACAWALSPDSSYPGLSPRSPDLRAAESEGWGVGLWPHAQQRFKE